MPLFPVETYKVSSSLERFSGSTRPSRVLEMAGPVLYHGIQSRALFSFSTAFDGVWSSPVAGYLADHGFAGTSVVGWFPLAEFSYYYDVLRAERPVHVLYEFRDAGVRSGYLRRVGLGTSVEPVGEGPSESVERISASLLERLSPSSASAPARSIPMPVAEDLPESANVAPGRERPEASNARAESA